MQKPCVAEGLGLRQALVAPLQCEAAQQLKEKRHFIAKNSIPLVQPKSFFLPGTPAATRASSPALSAAPALYVPGQAGSRRARPRSRQPQRARETPTQGGHRRGGRHLPSAPRMASRESAGSIGDALPSAKMAPAQLRSRHPAPPPCQSRPWRP